MWLTLLCCEWHHVRRPGHIVDMVHVAWVEWASPRLSMQPSCVLLSGWCFLIEQEPRSEKTRQMRTHLTRDQCLPDLAL